MRNTAEEEAQIARQIAGNPDEAEWTDEDWADAKSTEELLPEAAKAAHKRQADLDAGRTEFITLRLVLQRRFLSLVRFWREISSCKTKS